jgi:DNA-binding FadR family transcriptional regulator
VQHSSWEAAARYPPVKRGHATNAVVELLRNRILDGDLPPGLTLPGRRRLAALLGVSVPTLGAAICTLEHLGLIRVVQGRGTYVARRPRERRSLDVYIDKCRLDELLRLRGLIDTHAAAVAARRVHEGKDRMAPLADVQMWAGERAVAMYVNPEHLTEVDERFHDAVIRASGRQLLLAARLRARIERRIVLEATARQVGSRLRFSDEAELHSVVVAAIFAGNEGLAAAHARRLANIEADALAGALG